ncbi:ABC transporter ATP-binding protein [Halorussus amylolyticus]|uniref:ABC transporter ATP-binding protein n=1 Tax=Halorussus amylolyticus TaxID=1126242 RepID=UPI001049D9DD|nr:ABC transporter ATP-binding protein [Halorussus amylolyticus]
MELRTNNLGKRYSSTTWGVKEIDLELGTGIHGLLGPNGSGKSTLMRMLTTVMAPTEGTAYWNDTDITESPDTVRSVLGYLPQDFGVYPDLTLEEFLEYIGALRGLNSETTSARIAELLELTNLQQERDEKLKTFSGGMRQRVGIAQALLNDPDLLVVDEPTVGLDPEERVRFRNVLSEMAADRVVVLSTHIVPDIEATANSVALLDDGNLLTHTDPGSLIERVSGDVYEFVVSRDELETVREQYRVSSTVQQRNGVRARVIAKSPPTASATTVEPTLEDAYLQTIDGGVRA